MFGHVRRLGVVFAFGLASCSVDQKTDLSGTGGASGSSATGGAGGSGATGGAGGTGATGATGGSGGVAGQGGSGGVAGSSGTGATGGVAGSAGTPAGGGTGGVVDPCLGSCTDLNATCSGAGTCDCNANYSNVDTDGNAQTADCKSTVVTAVTVTVAITHGGCGNLVIKLGGPGSSVITLMSRPGEAESADDGSGGNAGDQSNMVSSSPVTFDDAATTSAEAMGQGPAGEVVCQDSGVCDYAPNQGSASGPATLALAFNGASALGLWRLCVGDAVNNDIGTLESFEVSITTSNHTFTGAVTSLGLSIPDNGYNGTLGPGSAACADIVIP